MHRSPSENHPSNLLLQDDVSSKCFVSLSDLQEKDDVVRIAVLLIDLRNASV